MMRILVLGSFWGLLALACNEGASQREYIAPTIAPNSTVGPPPSGDATGTTGPGSTPTGPTGQTPDAAAKLALGNAIDSGVPATYEGDIKPLLAKHCVSCHAGAAPKGGIDLSTPEKAQLQVVKIAATIRAKKMPPTAAGLPADAKASLDTLAALTDNWAKAPSNFALTLKEVVELNYTTAIGPLSEQLCLKCHSGEAPKNELLFENQEDWVDNFEGALAAVASAKMAPGIDEPRALRLRLLLEEWKVRNFP